MSHEHFDYVFALGLSLQDFKVPDGHSRTAALETVFRFWL